MDENDNQPDLQTGNVFNLLAYVLFRVRHSLEDQEDTERPPRWIRISRARVAQGESDYIGRGVAGAINGLAEGLAYMVEAMLDVEEILVQTDAMAAVVEVSADLVTAATDENFVNGVMAIIGQGPFPAGNNPLQGVGDVMATLKDVLDNIPHPEDVRRLGHELYRLLAIVQEDLPLNNAGDAIDEGAIGPSTTSHIDMVRSGKVRLMQWAFAAGTTTHGLGEDEEHEVELFRHGSRRVWETSNDKLPSRSHGQIQALTEMETIFDLRYDEFEEEEALRTKDLAEVHQLLEHLGYNIPDINLQAADRTQFTDKLTRMLVMFQRVNELVPTGRLDNDTINRLMHLDFAACNIHRAKPYDVALAGNPDPAERAGFLELINPDADHAEDEGVTPSAATGQDALYPYYVVGQLAPLAATPVTLPRGKGWIRDPRNGAIDGFVGLHSRGRVPGQPNRMMGGEFSEGEAATGGSYFFSARHTEPWKAGRSGTPDDGALFGGSKPPAGALSRIYQWVDLAMVQSARPAGDDFKLRLIAYVLQRSLYTDRGRLGLPDQGRLGLELYDNATFDGSNFGVARDPAAVQSSHYLDWFPGDQRVNAALTLSEIEMKRNWYPRSLMVDNVPAEATGVLVVLEGRYHSAFDIDAYFDNVRLAYSYYKVS